MHAYADRGAIGPRRAVAAEVRDLRGPDALRTSVPPPFQAHGSPRRGGGGKGGVRGVAGGVCVGGARLATLKREGEDTGLKSWGGSAPSLAEIGLP